MRRLILLAAVVLLCTGCRKKEPEPVTRLIPGELKAYWDFKIGSWCVYQDSTTGTVDTVKVTDYQHYYFDGTLSHSGDPAHCEYLEILTYNTTDQYYNRYWISTSYSTSKGLEYNVVFRTKFGGPNGGYVGGTNCFVYPFNEGNTVYDSDGQHDDTITVKNVYVSLWSYPDVVEINQSYNLVEGDQHTRTYWSKDVGIVKQVFVDSAVTKTLIDYHIEP